jgi:putative addiction module component (TIGR02574 family)
MNTFDITEEIRRLSVDERIRLVQDIWDGIAADTEPPPLTDEQRSEVARRIAEHERGASRAIPWDEALATLRERYG